MSWALITILLCLPLPCSRAPQHLTYWTSFGFSFGNLKRLQECLPEGCMRLLTICRPPGSKYDKACESETGYGWGRAVFSPFAGTERLRTPQAKRDWDTTDKDQICSQTVAHQWSCKHRQMTYRPINDLLAEAIKNARSKWFESNVGIQSPVTSDFTSLGRSPCFHFISAQELYRLSKENSDFQVTAGPSKSNDDRGSSGGDSGGNSPSSSSHGSATPKKTSECTHPQQPRQKRQMRLLFTPKKGNFIVQRYNNKLNSQSTFQTHRYPVLHTEVQNQDKAWK